MKNQKFVLNLIVLGDPAAGKATQIDYLVKKYKLYDLDMGKVLRQSRASNKTINEAMHKTVDQGKLAPTAIVRKIMADTIKKVPRHQGIAFDGTPKMLGEAKLVTKLLGETKRTNPLVMYLQIPLDETVKRMQSRKEYNKNKFSKRTDDNTQALKNRVKYYRKNISEVMDYFHDKFALAHINGLGTRAQVRKRIQLAVEFYLKNYEQINQKT